jgi:hydrogenase expression/formation protein HypD
MGGIDPSRDSIGNNEIKIMEVCGTHTRVIAQMGIKKIMPPEIRMISGPGCPVCVTDVDDIDRVIELAQEDLYIATFGDFMKVPGSNSSLEIEKARGKKSEWCILR